MSNPDLVYTGIFLEPMDTQRLLRTFGRALPNVQAHHMTIWHSSEETPPRLNLPWGKTVSMKIVGHAEDDRVQVAIVEPPLGVRPVGRIPHVTISTAPGIGPKVANDLLESWSPDEKMPGLPVLRGKVGWVDSKQKIHFDAPPAIPEVA